MTLIVEKHPEFERLARYFQKIETLADHMGVGVDELVRQKEKGTVIERNFDAEQQRLSRHRKGLITSTLSVVK